MKEIEKRRAIRIIQVFHMRSAEHHIFTISTVNYISVLTYSFLEKSNSFKF